MLRRAYLVSALFVLGCNADVATTGSSTGNPEPKPQPEIHFFAGTEVTRVFYPEQVDVKLTGFAPKSQVTLRATLSNYASYATFTVGDDGTVDVATTAPTDGTYDGADPDGMFWSMVAVDPPPEAPTTVIDVPMQAEVDGNVVATATLARYAQADGLQETVVSDNGLDGLFVTPADPGPHPAILAFGGSEGGLSGGAGLAHFYASLGYSVLGIAYFADKNLPLQLNEIPLEYFRTALDWLKARPEVKPDKIAVFGGSRGGELALLLGATFPDVKAVVAQVPSGVIFPGYDNQKGVVSSWTNAGVDLPYLPPDFSAKPTYMKDAQGHNVETDSPAIDQSLDAAPAAALDAATTRVEKTTGPILMLAGGDDQLWPSCRLAQYAMDRLVAAGHDKQFADDYQCYPGAGHLIGSPGAPTTNPPIGQHPITKGWLNFGGTPIGYAHADRDAFERKKAFLAAALGQ